DSCVDQSRRNCIRDRRDVRIPHQPKVRSLDARFSVYDSVDEPNGVPPSPYMSDASDQAGDHLIDGADSGDCDALFSASRLEEDLRDCGMHGVVLQLLRFCRSVLRKSASAKGHCAHAKRAAICGGANCPFTTFCRSDYICGEEIPHCPIIFATWLPRDAEECGHCRERQTFAPNCTA